MITLFTLSVIVYIAATVCAGMAFATICHRRFGWDEAGVALIMICFFWFIPITAAMDLGWIQ